MSQQVELELKALVVGPRGIGVPAGGQPGQVVTRTEDGTQWADPPSGPGGGLQPGAGLAELDAGAAAKLSGIEAGAQANVQPDWNAEPDAPGAILNKPSSIGVEASWDDLKDKPAVVAAGETLQEARAAIGAGTSSFSGAYADLSDKPSIPSQASDVNAVPTSRTVNGKALSSDVTLSAADVGALSANTPLLALGYTDATAKPGDWKPAAADVADASSVGRSIMTAPTAAAAREVLEIDENGGPAPTTITTHTTLPVDGVSTDNPYLYYDQPSGIAKMYLRTPGGVYIELGGSQVDPGTPPESIDPNAMLLGMNFEWIRSWTLTAKVFSNLMYQANVIERTSGSGTWTFDRGNITSTDPDAVFRLKLLDGGLGVNMPEGEYTVLNPSGNTIYIGGVGPIGAGDGGWRTDTSFTVNLSGGGAKFLHAKGGLSNANGNTCVIMPGHLESWNSGNVWYDKCLSFYAGLKLKTLRFMDAINASDNLEADWAERSLPTAPTLNNAWGVGFYLNMTHELICDLANRLGVDPWICVPHRATQDYVEQMAALYKAHLNPDRKVWLEGTGNEVWNNGAAWASGTNWIAYLDFTKHEATADVANQNFVSASHGLSSGSVIKMFEHIDNRKALPSADYRLKRGTSMYAKVLDADTFEVYTSYSGGVFSDKPVIPAGFNKILYVDKSESGKTADMNGNYAVVAKRNWAAFDAEFGRERVVHVMARQFGNTSTISQALAVSGAKEATDYVAVAPYFSGIWCGAKLSAADGTITPQWWANASTTAKIGIYTHGATPTMQEVIDGTDAVATQTITYGADSSSWSPGTAISGLTNETEYDVHFVFSDADADFRLVGSITPSASAVDPVIVTDSFANQALRNILSSHGSTRLGQWTAVKSAADGVPLVNYECGLHFHESSPPEIKAWLASYQESPEFAEAIAADMLFNQVNGTKDYNYYAAVLGTVFSIANSYDDTSDNRYLEYAEKNGVINPVAAIDVAANITADDVKTEPSSFPATVYTFTDSEATYSIIGGNKSERFAISGNVLQYVDGTGFDYDDPELQTLSIAVSKGGQTVFTTVKFQLGDSWYESDAIFAFDSFKDTDTAAINPQVGSPIAKSGSGEVVVSDGIWQLPAEVRYYGDSATTEASFANDIFFATVLKFGSSITAYTYVAQLGNNPRLAFQTEAASKVKGSLVGTGGVSALSLAARINSTAVYWCVFRGGKYLTYGINQDIQGTAELETALVTTLNRVVSFGDDRSGKTLVAFGCAQAVQRSSISDAEAKAMVAKMQALHGIS